MAMVDFELMTKIEILLTAMPIQEEY